MGYGTASTLNGYSFEDYSPSKESLQQVNYQTVSLLCTNVNLMRSVLTLKRTLGTIMILIGALFGLGFPGSFPKSISKLGTITAEQGWTAYAYGYLLAMFLLPVVAFLLIRYGIKLSKS